MNSNHSDIIIIGAGVSGIGAACHLAINNPDKSVKILEAREELGGTWSLFKYPGIRSDSDMYTFGYAFKTWDDTRSFADAESIKRYITEAAEENDVLDKIQYSQKLKSANFDTASALWNLSVLNPITDEKTEYTAKYVFVCTGYYDYDQGYTPEFKGRENFKGQIIHPQFWPEDLDYADKEVVVIGSGATAVTLIPSMADETKHITMLQRSPTYMAAVPLEDGIAKFLKKILPKKLAHKLIRVKNIGYTMAFFNACRKWPNFFKSLIIKGAKKELDGAIPVDPHFVPNYKPWDQRFCMAPDGDFFKVVREGKATVVTDQIETFTENGIRLQSGKELKADMIITATGLNMLVGGGAEIKIDGQDYDIATKLMYKGLMLSDLPNAVMFTGYTNASWTLKVNLVSDFMSRVIKFMDKQGYDYFMPTIKDPELGIEPLLNLDSGYIKRSEHTFPKQGDKLPWKLYQNFFRDYVTLNHKKINDEGLEFLKKAA
ncbi:MAG: NAD(P)/FAD-dependent oxidoreductase [Gammaproteobacteria bacterium]|nr:NAD(P)/FAD-dependent oxidoreductase [Gammaproteobacteria bacterium]NNC97866.1 NAD(P)/FAD-dependent oxidoreductase [Gammaproteobacteria bacterium]NNM14015.1 NAD(P)/FAD-dependent oxidoreductase [Gammaproteobacteria bacterium]